VAIKIPKIKKKTSLKTKLTALLMGLIALGIIAFLGFSNWRIYGNCRALDDEIEKLKHQAQILDERRQTLKAGLEAAAGETFQEERMREQGYKKPGEEVIAILRDPATSATNQEGQVFGDSFWVDLWQKIKNIK